MGTEAELKIYNWTTDELLLLDWYAQLVQSGDMGLAFTKDLRYPGNFLQYFRPPRTLAYATDARGIWFAAHVDAIDSGCFFGCWIREEKRTTPTALKLLIKVYDEVFKASAVIIGLSWQPYLLDIHKKLGYAHLGAIPGLHDGAAVDVYYMTRDMWQKRAHARIEK